MVKSLASVLLLLLLPNLVPQAVLADEQTDRRIAELERRIEHLPTPIQTHGPDGAVFFLFGAFCALWAQNTGRNAWLWFFLGLFFNVITVLVLLWKNSDDRAQRRSKGGGSFLDA
ncbi:MAG: hypothetical protein ACLQIB_25615 [Isosphaeraceae bacterium]